MPPRHRRLTALALLVVGAIAFTLWWQSDRQRIGRQVSRIQKLTAKQPGEHSLTGLNKARQISELFASPFEVRAPQYNVVTSDRRTLIGAINRFRSRSDRVAMKVSDRELWIDAEFGRATLRMVVSFATGLGGLSSREAYRVEMNLMEEAGEWRIDYLELLEVLEGPGRPW